MNHSAQSFRHQSFRTSRMEILSRDCAFYRRIPISLSFSPSRRAIANSICRRTWTRNARFLHLLLPLLSPLNEMRSCAGNECGLRRRKWEKDARSRVLPHLMTRPSSIPIGRVVLFLFLLFLPVIRHEILPWKRSLFTANYYTAFFGFLSARLNTIFYSLRYNDRLLPSFILCESGSTHAFSIARIHFPCLLQYSVAFYTRLLCHAEHCEVECLKEYSINSLIAFVSQPGSHFLPRRSEIRLGEQLLLAFFNIQR